MPEKIQFCKTMSLLKMLLIFANMLCKNIQGLQYFTDSYVWMLEGCYNGNPFYFGQYI